MKHNIILDLDECLIHSILYSDIQTNKNIQNAKFSSYERELEERGIYMNIFKYAFINNRIEYSVTYRRPYLKEFIKYLFDNYNVSVWSNGYYTYVDKICSLIFTKIQKKKLKNIFGAKLDNKNMIVYNIKTKKILYNLGEKKGCKDLSYLFNNKPYNKTYTIENTILIDDSINHLEFNKTNVINVKKWYFYNNKDTILLHIIDYLKKNSKDINTMKLNNFTKIRGVKKTRKKKHQTKASKTYIR